MRTKLLIGAVAFGMGLATPALAEDWDFNLKNKTDKPIKAVELTPTGAVEWKSATADPEIAKDKGLASGEVTKVFFDKAAKKCRYDVKLTFGDDSSMIWPNIDVCNNTSFAFILKDGKPVLG